MKKKEIQTHFAAERRYVTEKELSRIIGKSRQGLQMDRFKGQHIPYIKFGGKVFYDMKEVHGYMSEHTIRPEN